MLTETSSVACSNLGGGHRGYGKVDLPKSTSSGIGHSLGKANLTFLLNTLNKIE